MWLCRVISEFALLVSVSKPQMDMELPGQILISIWKKSKYDNMKIMIINQFPWLRLPSCKEAVQLFLAAVPLTAAIFFSLLPHSHSVQLFDSLGSVGIVPMEYPIFYYFPPNEKKHLQLKYIAYCLVLFVKKNSGTTSNVLSYKYSHCITEFSMGRVLNILLSIGVTVRVWLNEKVCIRGMANKKNHTFFSSTKRMDVVLRMSGDTKLLFLSSLDDMRLPPTKRQIDGCGCNFVNCNLPDAINKMHVVDIDLSSTVLICAVLFLSQTAENIKVKMLRET
ncbi:hypothetical protein T02_10924 [Trichinella nativa]|uniref:Uncharacterized protein n=1 Tax=Trichinella nativa TaxID=6335 RepID=A0A0V1LNU5_9BILA|nr:hypothetical protein T02_10924 [Trichinella nativa]